METSPNTATNEIPTMAMAITPSIRVNPDCWSDPDSTLPLAVSLAINLITSGSHFFLPLIEKSI
jgi:hypothetical protein